MKKRTQSNPDLARLADLIADAEIAMLTTEDPDGTLRSRPHDAGDGCARTALVLHRALYAQGGRHGPTPQSEPELRRCDAPVLRVDLGPCQAAARSGQGAGPLDPAFEAMVPLRPG